MGVSYDIEFWLNTAVRPNFFSVSFDGSVLDSLTDITTSSSILPPFFKLFSYTALASSASTDLVFTFRHDPWGWDLDDVTVNVSSFETARFRSPDPCCSWAQDSSSSPDGCESSDIRDPARIDAVLATIREIWMRGPDLRLERE